MLKNLPAMRETQVRSLGGKRPPGEGNGYPLLYSCLKIFMDRGTWLVINLWGHREHLTLSLLLFMGFPGGTSGKEPACQCRRHERLGFDPGSGRSPGGGHGNPLHCSCLDNPMDGGTWRATVHGVTKSWTQLKRLSGHARPYNPRVTITVYVYLCAMFLPLQYRLSQAPVRCLEPTKYKGHDWGLREVRRFVSRSK